MLSRGHDFSLDKKMIHETSNLSGQKCHYKLKNKIMRKFFDEPVDALDLRLTKLEASLTVIPDPWSSRCKEEPQAAPLDYSEVQIFSEDCREHSEVTSSSNDREDVQFIAASSLKSFRHHPYHSYQKRDGTVLVSPSIVRHVSEATEVIVSIMIILSLRIFKHNNIFNC